MPWRAAPRAGDGWDQTGSRRAVACLVLGLSVIGCGVGAEGVSHGTVAVPWPTRTPFIRERDLGAGPEVPQALRPTATLLPTPTPTRVHWDLPAAMKPPSRLEIPSVDISVAIVPLQWVPAADGIGGWEDPGEYAGWLRGSALPGEGSNVVIVGHHNIQGQVFRDLVQVQIGDSISLEADGRVYPYVVSERFIIPEKDVSEEQRRQNALWIAPTYDERLTLVTCWPYRDNTHRLIVVAKPASPGGEP